MPIRYDTKYGPKLPLLHSFYEPPNHDLRNNLKDASKHSKSSNFINSLLRVFWTLVCLSGLLYQMYVVTEDYLAYTVTTTTTCSVTRKVTPPVLSICFGFVDVRKIEMFASNSSCSQRKLVQNLTLYGRCYTEIMAMTLKEILVRTRSFTDITEKIWYRNPVDYSDMYVMRNDSVEFERYRITHVTEFFKGDRKCFTMNIFTTGQLKVTNFYYRLVINDKISEGKILTWFYDKKILDECQQVAIYMHPPHQHPMGYLISPYLANVSMYRNEVLTYRKIENTLLPSPYPTECVDYETNEYESQMHCMEGCFTNYTIYETNGTMPD